MGAKLFHEGQFEGREVRLPVFLGRRPDETLDAETQEFYRKLLSAIDNPVFRDGQWTLCERTGWPDNQSFINIVAWRWSSGEERNLIVVNLSDTPAQALVHLNWSDLGNQTWKLTDLLSGSEYERHGGKLRSSGLYVELAPWSYHVLAVAGVHAKLLGTSNACV